ncbi:MAG: hypothetical protein ABIK92_04155 [Pseudomonadota bacterium]
MVDSFFDALPEYLELIMGYIPVLIIIAIPIAVFIVRRKTQNETNIAKQTAGMLGLRYINVAEEMKDKKPEDSFLLGLLSGWSPWAMEGTYNNIPVRVESIVKGKQQRYIAHSDRVSVSNPTRTSYSRGTTYVASFEKPLPFDIAIHKKVNMPFGFPQLHATDAIETGDEELDQMLEISGNDKSNIQKWLNLNQRKDVLKRMFRASLSVNINSKGLLLHDLHSKAEYDHVRNNLKTLNDTILKLQMD